MELDGQVGFADVDPEMHGRHDYDELKVAEELAPGDAFRYVFDLGDDWRHRYEVLAERADPREDYGPGHCRVGRWRSGVGNRYRISTDA